MHIKNKLKMRRILGDVSATDMKGCIEKIMELLGHKQLGHYYLHQLGQFLSDVPTSSLSQKWLKELSTYFIWKQAEDHFKKTKQVWYNELEWPFQICVLEIGGFDNETLRKKWLRTFSGFYERQMTDHIDDFDLLSETKKRKIYLIRVQARHLGFPGGTPFNKINCDHPDFNLSLCPPETAFFVRLLTKEYLDSKPTIFASKFQPTDTTERIFRFCNPKRYVDSVYMKACDVTLDDNQGANDYWVFQYNQTIKNSIDDL